MEYDYNVLCAWKFEKPGSALEGTAEIKEMDAVSGKEPTIEVRLGAASPAEAALTAELKTRIKACIVQFIQELNSK